MNSLRRIFYFFSQSELLKFFSYVSYHLWENTVVVHSIAPEWILALSVIFSDTVHKNSNLINRFSETWIICDFFQIHLMMPEVIHGECSRLCVTNLCLTGKVLIQKSAHENNYVLRAFIRIWVRWGALDAFIINTFSILVLLKVKLSIASTNVLTNGFST